VAAALPSRENPLHDLIAPLALATRRRRHAQQGFVYQLNRSACSVKLLLPVRAINSYTLHQS
jgi:hypothetical protein